MKKLYSLLLAIMMIATIALPVFAEESVDANGGSANVNVNGVVQYTGSSETQTISVDVAWGGYDLHLCRGRSFRLESRES